MSRQRSNSATSRVVARPVMSWLCTIPYTLVFILILVLSHPFHMFAALFGRAAHKRALDIMNLCIVWNIRLLTGARYTVIGRPTLPPDRAVLIVSNHQSMYDIPMIMWECRKKEVGFVAKRELGRFIPSISFALRRLGSVLIDRKDASQAVRDIEAFGRAKAMSNQVAAIFPEGTRARDGALKRFKTTGLAALLRSMPTALIQPVAITGNWELLRYNFWPVPYGTSIELTFLPPIEPTELGDGDLTNLIERVIQDSVNRSERETK
jgi:1-acyl-sn-glycerol-3-phosphate acyltransferase